MRSGEAPTEGGKPKLQSGERAITVALADERDELEIIMSYCPCNYDSWLLDNFTFVGKGQKDAPSSGPVSGAVSR
jgi:hypothetical protein